MIATEHAPKSVKLFIKSPAAMYFIRLDYNEQSGTYPFTTITGFNRATNLASPALCTTFTTC